MSGRVSDKTEKDNLRVWDCYWKHYAAAGELAKKLPKKHFGELVWKEIGYQPEVAVRKINQMLKHRPAPCL